MQTQIQQAMNAVIFEDTSPTSYLLKLAASVAASWRPKVQRLESVSSCKIRQLAASLRALIGHLSASRLSAETLLRVASLQRPFAWMADGSEWQVM
jgi:hypothetical protein